MTVPSDPHDRVGAPEPARVARGAGVGFRKARPRLLVEEYELTAFAVQVAGAAEVEQGCDGFRADAALSVCSPDAVDLVSFCSPPGNAPEKTADAKASANRTLFRASLTPENPTAPYAPLRMHVSPRRGSLSLPAGRLHS